MECLTCGGDTKVSNSIKYAGTVYRQRKCLDCSSIFWTEELEVVEPQFVRDALKFKRGKYADRT